MEIAVAIFAGVGLVATITVVLLTLYVWLEWWWQAALEATGAWLGCYYATIFYVGLTLQPKEKRGWYTGRLLGVRYRRLKENEPEVAKEFELDVFGQQLESNDKPPGIFTEEPD